MHNEYYTTEYAVEKKFIEIMTTNWYHFNPMSSYEELVDNFRDKLNLLNSRVLEGEPLTDDEFKEIKLQLERKSIIEASFALRWDKIPLKRKNKTIWLKLVDVDDIEKNYFEVAHQIKTQNKFHGRFDVTLLLNGLPFVQIELKSPKVEINEAFNQIVRYKRDGNYLGLFNFIQIFVISNESQIRYFANNDIILKSDCFKWANVQNEPIEKLYEFEENFLFCPFLFKVIFHYMIASASKKKLYVMRPYQIYAFEALRERCLENRNGYCFHSTGSGKTLTAFKFAYEMSLDKDIAKVFFLVDRKDLDSKTIDDFNSYMSSTANKFTEIKETNSLIRSILSDKKLIIATINKMANALKGKNRDKLAEFKDKKIIFMFDECHRSQAGLMRKIIQNYFTNALYYGFTGTPIFNEEDEKTQNAKLTKIYFGDPVHTYTLKQAIGDGNVLPLCIDYVKTVKKKDNDELTFFDKEVEGINYQEALLAPNRCDAIVQHIFDCYDSKTRNREYNAIFACESIALLNMYYKRLLNNNMNIKIAAIYSYEPNEDCKDGDIQSVAKDELVKIIEEYNKRPENNSNFNLSTYAQYEKDVIDKFDNKMIDILLVVDKCLTGMDFKRCNTLFLDKSMRMHGLIQAFSRTIRTYKESKICGNIVCFQTSRKAVDDALAHFNNDKDVYNDVTLEPLEKLIPKLNDAFNFCKTIKKYAFSNSESERVSFVNTFRDLMRIYNKINNYIDFDINKTEMDMSTYNELLGFYKKIYNELKPNIYRESILNNIDFEIELLARVKVNFDYLVELLFRYQQDHKQRNKTKERINKFVLEINDKSKRELIEKFINKFMDENIEGLYPKDPILAYEQFINEEKDNALTDMSVKYHINKGDLQVITENYAFFQDETQLNSDVVDLVKDNKISIDERLQLFNKLPIEIKGYFDKFNDLTIY